MKNIWIEALKMVAEQLTEFVGSDDARPEKIKRIILLCEEKKFKEAECLVDHLLDQLWMGQESARSYSTSEDCKDPDKMMRKANAFEDAYDLLSFLRNRWG